MRGPSQFSVKEFSGVRSVTVYSLEAVQALRPHKRRRQALVFTIDVFV